MKSRLSNLFMQLLKVSVAAVLLTYLFKSGRIDIAQLRTILHPGVMVGGLLCIGVVLFFASERWRLLLKQQGLATSAPAAFRLTLIGTFFNFFIPGGVGGDVIKALLIAQDHPERRGQAVLTVLADRILGLFTMVFLALVAFIFEADWLAKDKSFQLIFAGLSVLFLGFLIAFWILLSSRTAALREFVGRLTQRVHRLHKLWTFAQTYHLSPREWIRLCLLSLGTQVCQILLFVFVAQGLGPLPPASLFFFAVPVGFIVTAIPIAPGGIGLGQAAFLYLFAKGDASEIGVVGITAFQAFQFCYGLLGSVLFVLMKRRDPRVSIQELEKAQVALE